MNHPALLTRVDLGFPLQYDPVEQQYDPVKQQIAWP